MGCYVMEPEVFNLIPKNKSYGMDDVIKKAGDAIERIETSDRGNKGKSADAEKGEEQSPANAEPLEHHSTSVAMIRQLFRGEAINVTCFPDIPAECLEAGDVAIFVKANRPQGRIEFCFL